MTENRHIKRSIARERVRAAAAPASPARWLVAFIGLLALAIQSFVVQAHIHLPQGGIQTASLAAPAKNVATQSILLAAGRTAATPGDKYPIGGDPPSCPLCQAVAHSGQFLQSTAALAAIPSSVSVHFIIFSEALPSFFAVSHSWQGRAPPQA